MTRGARLVLARRRQPPSRTNRFGSRRWFLVVWFWFSTPTSGGGTTTTPEDGSEARDGGLEPEPPDWTCSEPSRMESGRDRRRENGPVLDRCASGQTGPARRWHGSCPDTHASAFDSSCACNHADVPHSGASSSGCAIRSHAYIFGSSTYSAVSVSPECVPSDRRIGSRVRDVGATYEHNVSAPCQATRGAVEPCQATRGAVEPLAGHRKTEGRVVFTTRP